MHLHRIFPIVLCTMFVLCACDEKETLPVEEEKLIDVLTDIHIAEAALKQFSGSQKDTAAFVLYEQIYTIHQVEGEAVDSSLARLKKSPERMEKLYEKMMEKIEKMKVQQ